MRAFIVITPIVGFFLGLGLGSEPVRAATPADPCPQGLRGGLTHVMVDTGWDIRQPALHAENAVRRLNTDVHAVMRHFSPGEPGGDLFRIVDRPDGRLSLFLADVEGHGHTAHPDARALDRFMSQPGFARRLGSGATEGLEYIDQNFRPKLALSMAHVVLDPATGRIEFANAGLPYLRIRKKSGQIVELEASGMYVGEDLREIAYSAEHSETAHYQLAPGDQVIFVTDGAVDAQLQAPPGSKLVAQEILDQSARAPIDDTTVMVVDWSPPAGPPSPR